MTIPLLQTKFYVPPVRSNLVPRRHLIERLDEGLRLGHRLTLVSAPAGFGKTTLLSEWAHDLETRFLGKNLVSGPPRAVAWLSLDEGDNDPTRFLAYLAAALRTVGVEVEEDIFAGAGVPAAMEACLT
ncbi:MAG: AAA family ATPase, partial [Proteobacteria bacterium]|nr:AAA family ATPase [Pseudomonadota bacterium]